MKEIISRKNLYMFLKDVRFLRPAVGYSDGD